MVYMIIGPLAQRKTDTFQNSDSLKSLPAFTVVKLGTWKQAFLPEDTEPLLSD